MALSEYTKVNNCTDLSDVRAGIQEIKEYFALQEKKGKKPSDKSYVRLGRLKRKEERLQKREFQYSEFSGEEDLIVTFIGHNGYFCISLNGECIHSVKSRKAHIKRLRALESNIR